MNAFVPDRNIGGASEELPVWHCPRQLREYSFDTLVVLQKDYKAVRLGVTAKARLILEVAVDYLTPTVPLGASCQGEVVPGADTKTICCRSQNFNHVDTQQVHPLDVTYAPMC